MGSLTWRKLVTLVVGVLWIVTAVVVLYTLYQWIQASPGDFEPLHTLAALALSAITVVLTWLRSSAPDKPISPVPEYDINSSRNRRNRQVVLQNVKNAWIKGILGNSLHHAVYIELGKEYKPEAVQRPWGITLRQSNQPERQIPDDTKIIDVFKENGRSLLILGEPGSGKTITLLHLTRDLIVEAEQDETKPIPLVFNLSSWTEKQPLEEWLLEEMLLMYQVPRKIGLAWIAADTLTLLLDGLDEVKRGYREACVTAVNHFREEHMIDIVVCSRAQDYEALNNGLNLRTALTITPLNQSQIDLYLTGGGEQLNAARIAIKSDALLLELAQLPLNLNIIALVYRNKPLDQLAPGTLAERRKQLFTAYIERMFEHRQLPEPLTQDDITRRLKWLGYQMLERLKTLFYIEYLQPDWLPDGKTRQTYEFVVRRVVGVLAGIIHGILFGFGMGLFFALTIDLPTGIAAGLLFGVGFGVITWLGSFGVPYEPEIQLAERVSWSWKKANRGLFLGIFGGLLFALVIGFLTSLVSALFIGFWDGLALGTRVGILVWIVLGLLFGQSSWKNDGLVYEEIRLKTRPNQGIWLSLQNSIPMGLFSGIFDALFIGILAGLGFGLFSEFSGDTLYDLSNGFLGNGWQEGLYLGLGLGIYFGGVGMINGWWNSGGRTFIRHFTLRYLLARNNLLPWRLAEFLDVAVAHILLRRVAGGYIFVHRMIQEYFASLYQNSEEGPLELLPNGNKNILP
ncbi:MAG: NACHT domain-containing protein [Ardenticatenaceae bacterium]|nr:NACHT domain-containing protein [Ardenticatenaceae bacterium]